MIFSQYKMNKENCCACKNPYEVSTQRDFCQRCEKYIYLPTYEENIKSQLNLSLKASIICEKGQDLIYLLASEKIGTIRDHSDLDKATNFLNNLNDMIKKV